MKIINELFNKCKEKGYDCYISQSCIMGYTVSVFINKGLKVKNIITIHDADDYKRPIKQALEFLAQSGQID